jgi:hypothetical protein
LALGEEADFEALNFLPALNLIQSTKLDLTTEPAFCQAPVRACSYSIYDFGINALPSKNSSTI